MAAEYKAAQFFTELGWRIYWCLESQSRDDFFIVKDKVFKKFK